MTPPGPTAGAEVADRPYLRADAPTVTHSSARFSARGRPPRRTMLVRSLRPAFRRRQRQSSATWRWRREHPLARTAGKATSGPRRNLADIGRPPPVPRGLYRPHKAAASNVNALARLKITLPSLGADRSYEDRFDRV